MASRAGFDPNGRPDPGQILIVIHDFSARSSDELSLTKGDRVELIERDDDFGDGWYLGRHLVNGASGLFPEVYTRIAPRGPPSYPPSTTIPRSNPSLDSPISTQSSISPTTSAASIPVAIEPALPSPIVEADETPQGSRHASATEPIEVSALPSPFNTSLLSESDLFPIATPPEIAMQPKSLATTIKSANTRGQDSPVMNETLSVIDEHIIDMSAPHHNHSLTTTTSRGGGDSGSEYSSHLDHSHRMSYINGEETDEEEDQTNTREEVETWNPDQVAEYLFTSGVESKHCEVFRDQEITGDVLLGMDQTSVFLKEFDLGSVGRRLKTWQKIKGLQDEVNGETATRRNTGIFGSDAGSDQTGQHRIRSTNSSSVIPRIPSLSGSGQHTRLSQSQTMRNESAQPTPMSPVSPRTIYEGFRPAGDRRRPSAASIRDLHHSRQSSVNEYNTASLMGQVAEPLAPPATLQDAAHKKQPSFDKNWTMGSAASPTLPMRPLSSSGLKDATNNSTDHLSSTADSSITDILDRGYFSGGDVERKQRNVLKKRGSTAHSRNSSYTEEQRVRSATTTNNRHSRFGSVDSMRDPAPPTSATQKYYGMSLNGRRRTPSENSINPSSRPMPPPKDASTPIVTKLEGSPYDNPRSPNVRTGKGSDWLLPIKPIANKPFGLRAISDAVTGNEKSRLASPTDSVSSPFKDSPLQSPSHAGSSTPSAGPSFELDSPDARSASTMISAAPSSTKTSKRKNKKETSAFTQGLVKIGPKEQMIDADYSGWMKKKSTNMLATWKPRLFVLKKQRLSYYYSENDTEEKGLIDISFHRVLPADNDRLLGLHATLTGAQNSPTTPTAANITTISATEAAAEPESSLSKGGSDQMFIFKLVPPRAGLAKGVSFTKPTVHYFAVPNVKQGRLWMAALMKATIDRDESKPITTTYQQKTISLAKARDIRKYPPAFRDVEKPKDEENSRTATDDKTGLNIQGVMYEPQEGDSGVSLESTLNGSGSQSNGEPHTA